MKTLVCCALLSLTLIGAARASEAFPSEAPIPTHRAEVLLTALDASTTGYEIDLVDDAAASTKFALQFKGPGSSTRTRAPGSFVTMNFEADAGTYYLWLRGRGADALSDSAWIQFDREIGTSRGAGSPYGVGNWRDNAAATEYSWSSLTPGLRPVTVTLEESGSHQVRIFARQPGFALDQVCLSESLGALPSDPSPMVKLQRDPQKALFNGTDLSGWVKYGGGATYRVDDGCILGEVGPGPNSFLCTEEEFADFELRLELLLEEPGNSGIQIRSHVNDKGRVYGYQCEVDPSARAWSGGIFEEGARGWLFPLKDDPVAKAAFRLNDWNQYVIRAEGRRIQSWVNGIPCADYTEKTAKGSLSGFIGLQVHGGNKGRIRWRNLMIRSL